ncbi:GMC oxidoreductase [Nocardia violaceofusca]|uniref:GMC oxidoreductase n=1 Tax=Nocardia violaceofusca TaxID=941182 RepID=UPI0007A37140|nr:GMC oxidoreductase [Nocardia violaceofusca]
MTPMKRRSFLLGATAAGLTLATAATASAQPWMTTGRRQTSVPLTREDHRVVIIGSGFGGGVSALRLAEAGVDILVLERGMRWPTGPNADTFPHPTRPDRRMLWYRSAPEVLGVPVALEPYTGLLEAVVGENMTAVCAAGVGGGSLVYQGMTLQPSEATFSEVFPAELDYALMAREHYPRVARMLGAGVAPDELIDSPTYLPSRAFARNVGAAGYELSKIPMPIDWSFALREVRGEMKPSYINGDCALGVNNGGKHSVDVTYLARAEATGRATVRTQHEVTDVARTPDGRWQISVDRIDTAGRVVEHLVLTSNALIMAAGSINTTKLLLRAAAKGQIPDLPDGLGGQWGNNGDRIFTWTSATDDFGTAQGGPVVYGSKEWDDPAIANTVIQASIPPAGVDAHSTMLVGFGITDGRGHLAYDAATDDAKLYWPADADAALQQRIAARVHAIAGPGSTVLDTNAAAPSTWHPLGGAPMGTVCDLEGRVHGTRGLYVLDGALIPGSTAACNPSMTIAAVAERALDRIVATDIGTVI